MELELPLKQQQETIAVVEFWACNPIKQVHSEKNVQFHHIIKFHTAPELFSNRKVRIVRMEQLWCMIDCLLYVHQNTLFIDDATADWAVALTCYISHSVKHRKMTDFDSSGSRNPLTDFDETWHGDYVGDITPHGNFGRSGPT